MRNQILQALLKEYDFVSSLIPMYRRFEMQTLGIGILVYTSVLGLLVSSFIESKPDQLGLDDVTAGALAVLPWLISLLMFAFITMETRIIRASRHLDRTIAPKVKDLVNEDVLTWERSPGKHLSWLEKWFLSSSVWFILGLAAPALVAGGWYVFVIEDDPVPAVWARAGFSLLCLATLIGSWVSIFHEIRGGPKSVKKLPEKGQGDSETTKSQ